MVKASLTPPSSQCILLIELVDWTGRQIRPDKRGAISDNAPPILARLGIEQGNWLQNCQKLEEDFQQVIGPVAAIEKFCKAVGENGCKVFIAADDVLANEF